MPISLLKIKNFKSIRDLRLNCRKVNLLVGEPNTGKSNILEAIGLLSQVYHGDVKSFVRYEVMTDLYYDHLLGDPIVVNFDSNVLKVEFKNGRFRGLYTSKSSQKSIRLFSFDYQGVIDRNPHTDFLQFKFYRYSTHFDFPNQKSDFLQPPHGNNLLAIIMTNKRLKKLVRELFGKFGYRINLRPLERKIEVAKETEDILVSFPYSVASETLQRLVFHLAAMYSNKGSILTFEEPEAHAFPFYMKYLAERIALDKSKNQYFVATHNPYFLTAILEKTLNRDVAILVTYFENYETKVRPLTKKQKEEILEMGSDVFFNIRKFLG